MKPKTIKTIYWILTVLFSLAMIADAFGGITKQPQGIVVVQHLGYPVYIMPMFGVAKLLGTIALLQLKFKTLKEWAYAGFAFNFISAIVSRVIVGDAVSELVPPLVMLLILFISYYFRNRLEQLQKA